MMVVYKYLDDGDKQAKATDGVLPVLELLRQHRVRYVMSTEKGNIVLKHQPLRTKRIIDGIIRVIYPDFHTYVQELHDLTDGIEEEELLKPEISGRIVELTSKLRLMSQVYALGVIERPQLNDMDDFNDLYEQLTEDERDKLDMLIQELTNVCDPSIIDDTSLVIANRYGIQVIDKEMLEQITISQADYLIRQINAENEMMSNLMGEKVVK